MENEAKNGTSALGIMLGGLGTEQRAWVEEALKNYINAQPKGESIYLERHPFEAFIRVEGEVFAWGGGELACLTSPMKVYGVAKDAIYGDAVKCFLFLQAFGGGMMDELKLCWHVKYTLGMDDNAVSEALSGFACEWEGNTAEITRKGAGTSKILESERKAFIRMHEDVFTKFELTGIRKEAEEAYMKLLSNGVMSVKEYGLRAMKWSLRAEFFWFDWGKRELKSDMGACVRGVPEYGLQASVILSVVYTWKTGERWDGDYGVLFWHCREEWPSLLSRIGLSNVLDLDLNHFVWEFHDYYLGVSAFTEELFGD